MFGCFGLCRYTSAAYTWFTTLVEELKMKEKAATSKKVSRGLRQSRKRDEREARSKHCGRHTTIPRNAPHFKGSLP
jgi:hypothetical protein